MDNVPFILFRKKKNYIRDKERVLLGSHTPRAKKEDIQDLLLFFLTIHKAVKC